MSESNVAELTQSACRMLLSENEIGRVVLSIDAIPVALPVGYALLDGEIVFWTTPGSKLAAALNGTIVGFEIDWFDRDTKLGWSVVAVGHAHAVTNRGQVQRADDVVPRGWAPRAATHLVAVTIERLTGRCLTR